MSRVLVCNGCGRDVQVHEEPYEFIDPARFFCGPCMGDTRNGQQYELVFSKPPARTEARPYDPAVAAIPY